MHEMSIAEGIRTVLEDAAKANDFSKITRVRLEIGAFAGVERAALDFAEPETLDAEFADRRQENRAGIGQAHAGLAQVRFTEDANRQYVAAGESIGGNEKRDLLLLRG